jgi:hypothetical protein
MSDIMQARKALIARLLGSRRQCYRWKVSWIRLFAVSPNSPRILFKLWQRGIHLVPRCASHVHTSTCGLNQLGSSRLAVRIATS